MELTIRELVQKLCRDIECINEKYIDKNGNVLLSPGMITHLKELASKLAFLNNLG